MNIDDHQSGSFNGDGSFPAVVMDDNDNDEGTISPAIFTDVDYGFGSGFGCNFGRNNKNSWISSCGDPFNVSNRNTNNENGVAAIHHVVTNNRDSQFDLEAFVLTNGNEVRRQSKTKRKLGDEDETKNDNCDDDKSGNGSGGGLLQLLGREFRKRMGSSRPVSPDRITPSTLTSSTTAPTTANSSFNSSNNGNLDLDAAKDDPTTIDNELATDLAQLSVDQRNLVLEDIHGVHAFNKEDPKFVDKCIEQIYKEITKIPNSNRSAYNKANFLAPTRVSKNRKFNLMFLRAASFDPKATAHRIVKHFEFKLRLFGPAKLTHDITIDDLNEDDLSAYQSGYSLVLPGKDCTGRAVVVMTSKFTNCKTWENQLRANWYQMMAALQDEDVQIRGIVLVSYEVDRDYKQVQSHSLKDRLSSIPMYQEALPIRIASMHYCFNNPTINAVVQLFGRMYDKQTRMRFRFHSGCHMECQYALMSYGIPASLFLLDFEGNMKLDSIDRCIKNTKAAYPEQADLIESDTVFSSEVGVTAKQKKNFNVGDLVEVATDSDVLLGRGVPYQSHPGNMKLSKLIEESEEKFNNASKFDKTVITWELVKVIQDEYGGRFLERDCDSDNDVAAVASSTTTFEGGAWKVCTNEAARAKVAVGFRSRIKMQRRKIHGRQRKNQSDQEKRQRVS